MPLREAPWARLHPGQACQDFRDDCRGKPLKEGETEGLINKVFDAVYEWWSKNHPERATEGGEWKPIVKMKSGHYKRVKAKPVWDQDGRLESMHDNVLPSGGAYNLSLFTSSSDQAYYIAEHLISQGYFPTTEYEVEDLLSVFEKHLRED